MATPVMMPRQGQSVESCILTDWCVKPGDQVGEGDIIANYETDKASFELEAPAVPGLPTNGHPRDEQAPYSAHSPAERS